MSRTKQHTMKRAVAAAAAGNIVEWYDWSVYAIFALFFSSQFFPSDDPAAALISTFAIFAVGFLARPLGSVTLGRITDRMGRTTALSVSVTIVAIASALIGLAPTAEVIGLWAALWLVLLRIAQGLALGAETSAALTFLTESSSERRRGLMVSFYVSTVAIGTLIGSIVGLVLTSVLTADQMSEFGWRIPFFIGGALGFVALLVRRRAVETLSEDHTPDPHPIRTLWRNHRRLAADTVLLGGAVSLPFFVLVAGFPAIVDLLGATPQVAFGANVVGLVLLAIFMLVFGVVSDRIGRRPVLIFGAVSLFVITIPGVALLWDPTEAWKVYLAQVLAVIPLAALIGAVQTSLMERYPATLRGSAFGFMWAASMAIFGGTGPMIATTLAEQGVTFFMSAYFMALFAAAAIVAFRMKETAFAPLVK